MFDDAKNHFKKADPILYRAALVVELQEHVISDDLFRDIAWTIIGQQISSRAADSIFARFQNLLPKGAITPQAILKLDEEKMRASGLSNAKVCAIKNLAHAVGSGELDVTCLADLPDDAFTAELTKVKGIGPWTAQMLLMFSLNRPDVFSAGDLGLRKGIIELYGFKKLPSKKRLHKIINAWSPYRTYAARVLWRTADKKTRRIGRKRPPA